MRDKNKLMAERIAYAVDAHGGQTFYVGGFVRDELLKKESKDIDIEVHGIAPDELKMLLQDIGHIKTQGTSFGVYTIKGYDIDIALPRTEKASGRGHKDFEVCVDPFIGVDRAAARRDFTINAIMKNVLTGEIIDPYNGMDDLRNRRIRHVTDTSFVEDPLRVFRAAQFAARFDFDVDNTTKSLMKSMDTSSLSRERVYGEMKKALLKALKPSRFFEVLKETDNLHYWFPEVEALIGAKQSAKWHPEGDVWIHTMFCVDEAARYREKVLYPEFFMVTALCHDFGKVSCVTEENGVIHNIGHEEAGVPVAKKFLKRLNPDKHLHSYVLNIIANHGRAHDITFQNSRIKTSNLLFDKILYPEDLCYFILADSSAKGAGITPNAQAEYNCISERLAIYKKRAAEPIVSGYDLLKMGLTPSKEFSEILAEARKLHFSGVNKDSVIKYIYATRLKRKKK